MNVYGFGVIVGGLLGLVATASLSSSRQRQDDFMRMCDTIALGIKYLPLTLLGAAMGAGMIYLL